MLSGFSEMERETHAVLLYSPRCLFPSDPHGRGRRHRKESTVCRRMQRQHKGIAALVEGMPVDEVVKRLEGIQCGSRPTSCPDQLAKALKKVAEEQ